MHPELDTIMDVVVRTYSGKDSKELFSLLEKNKTGIEEMMRSVKGLVSYTLARSDDGDGGVSITVCQDKAGTEESVRLAKDWISQNSAEIHASPPEVLTGSVIIQASKH